MVNVAASFALFGAAALVCLALIALGRWIFGSTFGQAQQGLSGLRDQPISLSRYAGLLLVSVGVTGAWRWFHPTASPGPLFLAMALAFAGFRSWANVPFLERRRRQAVAVAMNLAVALLYHAAFRRRSTFDLVSEVFFVGLFPFVATISGDMPAAFWRRRLSVSAPEFAAMPPIPFAMDPVREDGRIETRVK